MPQRPITRRAFDNHRFGVGPAYLFKGKDDENMVNKALVMTKWTGSLAGFKSLADIVLVNNNRGLAFAIQRIINNFKPLVGGGLAYLAFTSIAAGFRKKEDGINHLYGGLGSGLVLGGHLRCIHSGINYTIVIGLIGAVYKEMVLDGGDLFPDLPVNKRHGFSLTHKTDCTMMADRPGYWVRTQEEADEIVRTGSRRQIY